MSGIVGVCPECGFSLRAHRTRVESALDHAPWCPSVARKDPQTPDCPHCDALRIELAQARAERDEAKSRHSDLATRAVLPLQRDLAACRATLQDLVEAVRVRDRPVCEGGPGLIAARKRLDAALARAEEEGNRDGNV